MNQYTIMKSSFFLAIFALSVAGQTENLKVYRDGLQTTEVSTVKGAERVNRLRAYMGTQSLQFTALTNQRDLFFEAQSKRKHRLNRSLYTKMILDKAMVALKGAAQWELPAGTTEEDKRKRRLEICQNIFGADMDAVVNQYIVMAMDYRNQHMAALTSPAAPPAADPTNASAARTAAISSYIAANDPLTRDAANKPVKITDILGDLHDVEMVDGYVSGLFFKNLEEVDVNLSMLLTFRAGEDSHYVHLLDCIGEYIRNSKESYEKDIEAAKDGKTVAIAKENVPLMTNVLAFVTHTYQESQAVHEYMSALSKAQQNLLIDLFLQLNANDIPAASEIEALKTYWVKLAEESKESKTKLVDFLYYVNRHEQLQRLEDKLYDEKERARIDALIQQHQGKN